MSQVWGDAPKWSLKLSNLFLWLRVDVPSRLLPILQKRKSLQMHMSQHAIVKTHVSKLNKLKKMLFEGVNTIAHTLNEKACASPARAPKEN